MVRFIPVLAVCALCHAAPQDVIPAQGSAPPRGIPLNAAPEQKLGSRLRGNDGVGAVYKCSAEGKVSYSDQPCARGPTVELAVPPSPPAAPALERTRRERETLAQIEKLRLERELRAEREDARERRAAAAQGRKCARLRLHRKWADEDLARAPAGAHADAARRKAQRQAEALAVECPA